MVNKELLINVAGNDVKVFMEANFFDFYTLDTSIHKHGYTELHCIEAGELEYFVEKEHICARAGEMVVIPQNTFHTKWPTDDGKHRICIFQADIPWVRAAKIKLSPNIFAGLFEAVEDYRKTGSSIRLSAILALICSYTVESEKNKVTNILDREFLISEFFAACHLDLTLGGLAKILNLSEKQTERAVFKYTGRHFQNELAYRRIEAAKYLLSTEKITRREAAERVGYKSYSGFYKAYKLYGGVT